MSHTPSDAASELSYQHCEPCGHVWYFVRSFCPRCGERNPATLPASGQGIVHAVTVVERAPTPDMKALAPYTLVMVDAGEGFRLMAHGQRGLAIGDRVAGQVVELAGRPVPFFKRA